jgi:hypothetical protein
MLPLGQAAHVGAPAAGQATRSTYTAEQERQLEASYPSVELDSNPGGQTVQAAFSSPIPPPTEYRPGSQAAHVVCAGADAKRPAAHTSHVVDDAFLYSPTRHGRASVRLKLSVYPSPTYAQAAAPAAEAMCSGAHSTHAVAPSAAANVPVGQVVQATEALTDDALPALQMVQPVAPACVAA